MDVVLSNLLIGIIGGLCATALTFVIQAYWIRVIIPWYEERIYKDAKVEGKWVGDIQTADNNVNPFTFNISRSSHRVYGTMINNRSGSIYSIEGEFRNMIMTLTYSSTQSHAVDRGCFTFLLINNGRQLDGHVVYYYSPEHRIYPAPVKVSREKS